MQQQLKPRLTERGELHRRHYPFLTRHKSESRKAFSYSCIFKEDTAALPDVTVFIGIGPVGKAEVIHRYSFTEATELRRRIRELGITIGRIECGDRDSITDVPGVSVGQLSLISREGTLVPGKGPVRTGVTVILPHEGDVYEEKLRAGVHVQNGAGELTGTLQVMEWGILETPIAD